MVVVVGEEEVRGRRVSDDCIVVSGALQTSRSVQHGVIRYSTGQNSIGSSSNLPTHLVDVVHEDTLVLEDVTL